MEFDDGEIFQWSKVGLPCDSVFLYTDCSFEYFLFIIFIFIFYVCSSQAKISSCHLIGHNKYI